MLISSRKVLLVYWNTLTIDAGWNERCTCYAIKEKNMAATYAI